MITYSNKDNDAVWELIGLSTDVKPKYTIPNGSSFKEMDTGDEYLFDLKNRTWHKQSSSSGSSGGSDTPSGDEIPGNVASDDEVQDALNDIFG